MLTDTAGQILWKGKAEVFGKTTADAASTVTNTSQQPRPGGRPQPGKYRALGQAQREGEVRPA
ncbi:MAG: hypothetical protein HYZ17_08105 [Betaproteobacteria bacterium]|nr:hypothetical protein [Betaproteobacteria bacterium]